MLFLGVVKHLIVLCLTTLPQHHWVPKRDISGSICPEWFWPLRKPEGFWTLSLLNDICDAHMVLEISKDRGRVPVYFPWWTSIPSPLCAVGAGFCEELTSQCWFPVSRNMNNTKIYLHNLPKKHQLGHPIFFFTYILCVVCLPCDGTHLPDEQVLFRYDNL